MATDLPSILGGEAQETRRLVDLLDDDDWPTAVERLTDAIQHLTADAARAQLFITIAMLSAIRRGETHLPPQP